ncbi:MAG TPA: hypothetical protein VM261_25230 [Kofleriaceae bacterium]|nr:hypothetical protein [Kofleriaceae bacterium]
MRTAFVLGMALALVGCKDGESRARGAAKDVEGAGRDVYAAGESAYAHGKSAVGVARTVKAELDKVYKTDSDYDLDITRAGASTDHAAKLAAMPHVSVNGVTVGYEEAATRSLHGVGYRKHFRATWRRGNEDVIVSFATQDNIDAVAFAKLVEKMVPIVEKAMD